MGKKIFVIVIVLVFAISLYSQNTNKQNPRTDNQQIDTTKKVKSKPKFVYKSAYDSLLLEGIKKINEQKLNDAVNLLNQAIAIDPTKWEVHYEKALAYYQAKEFDSTIAILEPFKDSEEVNDNFYQILGGSYDIKKEPDKALEIYQKGLKRFPNSGKLYMEMGIHYVEEMNGLQAVAYWHKGVDVEPTYENNYYWLARYLFFNYEFVWTIMYGELFMNLSDAPLRLDDISTFINDAFTEGFYSKVDSLTTQIQFTRINIKAKNLKEREDLPFELAYQIVMKEAADSLLPKKKENLTIQDIYKIRKSFIDIWYRDNWNKRYSNPLFDLQKKMIDNNIFETYHYWLLNSVRKMESERWLRDNKKKLEDFGNFMVKNKLKINKGNYFSRDKYSRGF
jgi:Tfp pilus assembly protein PilF